jgi:ATP-dependent helicase/nuclease subunit A
MSHPAAAASPTHNAVVHADAGTGKTWLLTSRIMRLLLDGVAPGAILAITFTRKAAAEIQERVLRRLLDLAVGDEEVIGQILADINAAGDAKTRERARALYELLLDADPPLRATTFHAFCQDILRRFPLEADVPAGFELLEDPGELLNSAWRDFDRHITFSSADAVTHAAQTLLAVCASPGALRAALAEFLAHRSDWWAYVEDHADPVAHAQSELARQLAIERLPPEAWHLPDDLRADFARYAQALARLDGSTAQQRAHAVTTALAASGDPQVLFRQLWRALFTQQDKLRAFAASAAMCKRLGEGPTAELVELHRRLGDRLAAIRALEQRRQTYALSCAWYRCGNWLLERYQRLKAESGLLDFADLEWATYRLLRRSQHAEWVQYKLDQRIDHLLIDEFQDTNPTQWRLVLPLLEEIAAGGSERARSVFLVGDEKQSIYRFRRAEPALFRTAHHWLATHMRAQTFSQHISWRSSPAIIAFVNLLFARRAEPASGETTEETSGFAIPEFRAHATRHEQRWGRVEVLPLVLAAVAEGDHVTSGLRNPLVAPRLVREDLRHREEGDLICARLRALIGQIIVEDGRPRPLDYGDVVILLRDRAHAQAYEEALRDAAIPYLGIGRGGLREALEVYDVTQLLRLLLAPYDNLALATVLRSPLCGATEADLIALARIEQPEVWYDRLLQLAEREPGIPIARTAQMLARWRALVDRVPVHDLLDRIYFEADVIARYRAAAPEHLRPRVEANLRRLLELALEVGAGRYPSLARFVQRLESASASDQDVAPATHGNRRVRVMTIHAAKGLEAPVVFLANAAADTRARDRGLRTLVEWPVEAPRPHHLHLIGKQEVLDEVSRAALARQRTAEQREETNLLYVALTRAKQWLFVSGVAPRNERSDTAARRGWYGFIEERLRAARDDGHAAAVGMQIEERPASDGDGPSNTFGTLAYGDLPARMAATPPEPAPPPVIDPALTRPFADGIEARAAGHGRPVGGLADGIAPPAQRPSAVEPEATAAARRRGTILHWMLQNLSEGQAPGDTLARARRDWPGASGLDRLLTEARGVIEAATLREFFDSRRFEVAHNELPLLYERNGQAVYGIVDRVVVRAEEVVVIDYKTHAHTKAPDIPMLAASYLTQLRAYAAGVARIWPQRRVRAYLVFTACAGVVEVPLE